MSAQAFANVDLSAGDANVAFAVWQLIWVQAAIVEVEAWTEQRFDIPVESITEPVDFNDNPETVADWKRSVG